MLMLDDNMLAYTRRTYKKETHKNKKKMGKEREKPFHRKEWKKALFKWEL